MIHQRFVLEWHNWKTFNCILKGAKIANHLQHIQENKDSPLNYNELFKNITQENIQKKIIEDEDIYPALFHDLCKKENNSNISQ